MKSAHQEAPNASGNSSQNGKDSPVATSNNGVSLPLHEIVSVFGRIRKSAGIVTAIFAPPLNGFLRLLNVLKIKTLRLFNQVLLLGVSPGMDEFARRRLSLVNQINILHFITCIIIPLFTLLNNPAISTLALVLSLSPSFVSILVLTLNALRRYQLALLVYFVLFPFVTCLIYLGGMNLGMELYFIVYGILAVFLFQDITYMVISVGFSMISYFMLTVVLKRYSFQLETVHPWFYMFNQGLAIVFIFYGLFLIKKENTRFQASIIRQNQELEKVNLEVARQNAIIQEKASELARKAEELKSLNSTKSRLFSIISHDLKLPMYALRNVFQMIGNGQIPPSEIRKIIPEVLNDINYTTDLVESLLQWAKNQMKGEVLNPQPLGVEALLRESVDLLRLQAEHKAISVSIDTGAPTTVLADRDTISIVLRNLLSNAIKFTPEQGNISVGSRAYDGKVEVSIADSGVGMDLESIRKLLNGDYYSTRGTENEPGTGLGLMLCREFVSRNGGTMSIHSDPGKGSVFSFSLPAFRGN